MKNICFVYIKHACKIFYKTIVTKVMFSAIYSSFHLGFKEKKMNACVLFVLYEAFIVKYYNLLILTK